MASNWMGLLALLLLVLLHTSEAIRCYECTKDDCMRKRPSELNQEECSSLLQIKTCMTVYEDEKQSKILYKSCGLPTKSSTGCESQEIKQFGLRLAYTCACDTHLCNAAPGLASPARALGAAIFALAIWAIGHQYQ